MGRPPTANSWGRLVDAPQEHDAYRKTLERLLRDLKVAASPASDG